MTKMQIRNDHQQLVKIVIGVAAVGFIVSHPRLLGWLSTQSPWFVFAVWYAVFFAFVWWIGLGVAKIYGKEFSPRQAAGLVILWFALSPILGYVNNPYLSEGLTGAQVTPIEAAPEETILTLLWMGVTRDPGTLLVLVYIVSPVLLVVAAFYVLKPGMFRRGVGGLVGP